MVGERDAFAPVDLSHNGRGHCSTSAAARAVMETVAGFIDPPQDSVVRSGADHWPHPLAVDWSKLGRWRLSRLNDPYGMARRAPEDEHRRCGHERRRDQHRRPEAVDEGRLRALGDGGTLGAEPI